MKLVQFVFVVSLVLGGLGALGCGSDSEEEGGTKDPPPVLDIRDGTWTLSQTVSLGGADSVCNVTPETYDTTLALCSYEPLDDGGPSGGFDCDVTTEGNDIQFSCSRVAAPPPCRIRETFSGGGTVTDTTLELRIASTIELRGQEPQYDEICDALYGEPVFACTLWVDMSGRWVSSEGDTACSEEPSGTRAVSLEGLLHTLPVAGRRIR